MAEDLFIAAARERLTRGAPLAARLRPTNLDEVVGQRHLLAAGKPLRSLIERSNKRPVEAFTVRRKAWSCLALAMLGHGDAIDLLDAGGMATGHTELYRYLSFRDATALITAPASMKRRPRGWRASIPRPID